MQIVCGGKDSWFHDLVIRGKTFAIVQQFETPYNKKVKKSLENLCDWRLIHENCESFPPQMICIIRYYVEADKTLCLIPPTGYRKHLFKEAHYGKFGAHLGDAKIHGQLSKHYWWPRMGADISGWFQGCLVCATRQPGKAVKPPLTPIPVEGPFHRVGVDVIQFVKSHSGNQYAIVFTDYLTT